MYNVFMNLVLKCNVTGRCTPKSLCDHINFKVIMLSYIIQIKYSILMIIKLFLNRLPSCTTYYNQSCGVFELRKVFEKYLRRFIWMFVVLALKYFFNEHLVVCNFELCIKI